MKNLKIKGDARHLLLFLIHLSISYIVHKSLQWRKSSPCLSFPGAKRRRRRNLMERFCEKILPHLLTVAGIMCLLCGGISLFYPEGSLIPGLGVIAMFVGTFFCLNGL
jgi:hypothetical protein